MLTAVNRSLDSWSSPYLASRRLRRRARLPPPVPRTSSTRSPARSTRAGWRGARRRCSALQTDAVHYYQRPDAGLPLDSSRTLLAGDAEEFKFDKVGGEHLMFESAYQRRSAGFEINDLGYLRRADQQSWNTWVGLLRPPQRRGSTIASSGTTTGGSTGRPAGLPLEAAYNTNVHITLRNNWSLHAGGTAGPARHDVRRPQRARRSGVPAGRIHRAVDRASTATTGAPSCRCSG